MAWYAVAMALCAAPGAIAQSANPPIDWNPRWQATPSQPGYGDSYFGWSGPRRTGPGPSHPGEHSAIVKDIHPPSPLGDRDRYAPGFTQMPIYEVIVVPGVNSCPPPYSSSGCVPMR